MAAACKQYHAVYAFDDTLNALTCAIGQYAIANWRPITEIRHVSFGAFDNDEMDVELIRCLIPDDRFDSLGYVGQIPLVYFY